jgi:peptidoglycan-N-acetylglucosamine deacetylase
MKNIKIALICLLMLCLGSLNAQVNDNRVWNNHKCAVVLTYDDGLNIDLDHVVPALDSMGFKGTFYVPGNSVSLNKRMPEWKAIAQNGHELGNHTLFHPCVGKGRSFVTPDYDLDHYTVTRFVDELRVANVMLKALEGSDERTFAYTCGDITAGDSVFVGLIKNDFISARTVKAKMEQIDQTDLFDVGAFMMMDHTGQQMIDLVKKAEETHSLIVFLFHGVGGEHSINVSTEAHSQLLHYLKDHEKDIWVAPFIDVTKYIRDYQLKHPVSPK